MITMHESITNFDELGRHFEAQRVEERKSFIAKQDIVHDVWGKEFSLDNWHIFHDKNISAVAITAIGFHIDMLIFH